MHVRMDSCKRDEVRTAHAAAPTVCSHAGQACAPPAQGGVGMRGPGPRWGARHPGASAQKDCACNSVPDRRAWLLNGPITQGFLPSRLLLSIPAWQTARLDAQ